MSITPPNGRPRVMALAPKYERLRAVLENSAKNVEGGAKTVRSEVADAGRSRPFMNAPTPRSVSPNVWAMRIAGAISPACISGTGTAATPASTSRSAGSSTRPVHDRDCRQRRTGPAGVAESRCRRFQLQRRLPRTRGDLAYVWPRSGRAVGREAGEPRRDQLLPLQSSSAIGGGRLRLLLDRSPARRMFGWPAALDRIDRLGLRPFRNHDEDITFANPTALPHRLRGATASPESR